jgi:hypothetical protein
MVTVEKADGAGVLMDGNPGDVDDFGDALLYAAQLVHATVI